MPKVNACNRFFRQESENISKNERFLGDFDFPQQKPSPFHAPLLFGFLSFVTKFVLQHISFPKKQTKEAMKAYIQTHENGDFLNVNGFVAYQGFKKLGWEAMPFFKLEEISDLNPEDIVVGGIGTVRARLEQLGEPKTTGEIDYPPSLQKYFRRKIWASTIQEILQDESKWGIFIKPQTETKKFTGKVVKRFGDFIGLVDDNNTPIWCSEVVDIKTEWRCFIRYGEILDIRRYYGAWDSKLDLQTVKNAVDDFEAAPAAYSLDFGVDAAGQMLLIEVNDGHSLGSYGMEDLRYAKFLSARWAEMTRTVDHLNF